MSWGVLCGACCRGLERTPCHDCSTKMRCHGANARTGPRSGRSLGASCMEDTGQRRSVRVTTAALARVNLRGAGLTPPRHRTSRVLWCVAVGSAGPGPAAHVDFSHTLEAKRVRTGGHVNGAEAAYDSSSDEDGGSGPPGGDQHASASAGAGDGGGMRKAASSGSFIAHKVRRWRRASPWRRVSPLCGGVSVGRCVR